MTLAIGPGSETSKAISIRSSPTICRVDGPSSRSVSPTRASTRAAAAHGPEHETGTLGPTNRTRARSPVRASLHLFLNPDLPVACGDARDASDSESRRTLFRIGTTCSALKQRAPVRNAPVPVGTSPPAIIGAGDGRLGRRDRRARSLIPPSIAARVRGIHHARAKRPDERPIRGRDKASPQRKNPQTMRARGSTDAPRAHRP